VILLGRRIGPGEPPYRISHAGASHDGDLQLGYKLVETAGAAGAEGVVLARGALSERDFKCVLGHATHVGLTPLGAPQGHEDVVLLASMDVPGVRLVDADALPPGLLSGASRRAWTMILSLRSAEVSAAVAVFEACRRGGAGPLAFLAPDPRMMEAWSEALPTCPVGLLATPEDGHVADGAQLIETTHRLPPALSRRNRS
jgi:sialic acid synthase SpsE